MTFLSEQKETVKTKTFSLSKILCDRHIYDTDIEIMKEIGEGYVYFLIMESEAECSIVYVGQTVQPENRLMHHSEDKSKCFTHFSIIGGIPQKFLDAVEYSYIYKFMPPQNIKYPFLDKDMLECINQ